MELVQKVLTRYKQAAGYVLGPGGLEKPGGTKITMQEGAAYYMGASTSPKFIVLTQVFNDTLKYKEYPFTGPERTIERWIAAELIDKGTRRHIQTYGKHMDPELKRSMLSLLSGGKGRKENLEDYKPVTVEVAPADDLKGQDLWDAAEEYGGVASLTIGGENVYEIDTQQKRVHEIKNDRRFKFLKVK